MVDISLAKQITTSSRIPVKPLYEDELIYEDPSTKSIRNILDIPPFPVCADKTIMPLFLTEMVANILVRAVRAGNSEQVACVFANLDWDAYKRYRTIAKESDEDQRTDYLKQRRQYLGGVFQAIELSHQLAIWDHVSVIQEASRTGFKTTRKTFEKVTTNGPEGLITKVTETVVEEDHGPDVRASQWLLARQHPEQWGRRVEMGVNISGEIGVNHTGILEQIAGNIDRFGASALPGSDEATDAEYIELEEDEDAEE